MRFTHDQSFHCFKRSCMGPEERPKGGGASCAWVSLGWGLCGGAFFWCLTFVSQVGVSGQSLWLVFVVGSALWPGCCLQFMSLSGAGAWGFGQCHDQCLLSVDLLVSQCIWFLRLVRHNSLVYTLISDSGLRYQRHLPVYKTMKHWFWDTDTR